MKGNNKLGAMLAVIGILTGLLIFYLLAQQYNLVIDAKTTAGRTDEATSVTITYAVLGDQLKYWQLFPAPQGFGNIPVWGFGEVIGSRPRRVCE